MKSYTIFVVYKYQWLSCILGRKKIEKKYSIVAGKPLSGFYVYNLSCIKSRNIWVFTQFS